jgi:hypothetical protein
LEALLGRRLAGEEQVSVVALGARPAPLGEARKIAADRLADCVQERSRKAGSIPQAEFDSLADEAMTGVRPRRG